MVDSTPVVPPTGTSRAEADAVLRLLGEARARDEYRLCLWLLCGFELEVHVEYGYAHFREYADRVFGWSGRQTEERLRVARVLRDSPVLAGSFERGELVYSVVRELTRVVDSTCEQAWLEAARGATSAELAAMVRGRSRGDSPDDSPTEGVDEPEPQSHRVTLELSASRYALFEEARLRLTEAMGGHVDDDTLAECLASAVMQTCDRAANDQSDGGKSAYQIAVSRCVDCERISMKAGSKEVVVAATTLEVAACDGQDIGVVHDGAAVPPRAAQSVPPRTRRAVEKRHRGRCAVPGCRNAAFTSVHHVEPRADGGTHHPDGLVLLCDAHHHAVHDCAITIRGRASTGFRFEHADGTTYGSRDVDARTAKVLAAACRRLSRRGVAMRAASEMVDVACPRVRADTTVNSVDDVVSEALKRRGVLERAS